MLCKLIRSPLLSLTLTAAGFSLLSCPPLSANEPPADRSGSSSQLTPLDIRVAIAADIEDSERFTGPLPVVEEENGLVRLSGTVDSLQERELASVIAKRTKGVKSVQNQILVKRSDRPDEAIQSDVNKVLRLNDSVAEPRVKAEVSRGRVTLVGTVESLAEKRIAEFTASGVRGVTEIENDINVVTSTHRTDEDLREEIKALIVQSIYFDDATVNVDVDEHVVSLEGSVPSVAAKDRLERVAEIWGVAAVDVSGIQVDPDAADPTQRKRRFAEVKDDAIRQAIRRSFRNDPLVFSRLAEITVSVNDGVVMLDGTVDRLRIRNRCETLVRDVVGVRVFKSDLEVERVDQKPTDMEIIRETQEAIARSAYLARRDVRVHCQRGHVSLFGIVESELEKRVADYVVSGVTGVVHVNNALAVDQKPSGKTDAEIQSALERKLQYALLDEGSDVEVSVENGVALLSGEVSTWRQWQAVMDLAIEAGAHHPHNLIDVRYHPPHGSQRYYVPQ